MRPLALLALLPLTTNTASAIEIAVEAEDFVRQTKDEVRRWRKTSATEQPEGLADPDPSHHEGASDGVYLELLPDTRVTHADKLEGGVSFSNVPGVVGVLDYRVDFPEAGRYYVWVRAHSTGSEDNGIHVGLNGEWPDSGQRMQWCEGKQQWWWESKQRTAKQHCGVPHKIYLDVPTAGEHTVSFSMREDGFEFDKFLLTTERERPRPEGTDP